MPTDCLFREDAYLTSTPATVLGLTEKGGIVVDRTCFYATSGGQPGDSGMLVTPAGEFPLATAVYNDQLKTEIAHVPADGVSERPAVGDKCTLETRLGPALPAHAHAHRAASALRRAALSGDGRRGERGRQPARFRYSGSRSRQGRDHREGQRDDQGGRGSALALDHRRGTRSQSGPGENHVGEAADRHRPRAADRDRRLRPAALRRHACAPHRRDRRGARDADREKGQAEPPRADLVASPDTSEREHPMAEEKLASRWLVSTEWLAARLNDPNVVVLDGSYYLANHKRDAEAEYPRRPYPGRAALRHRRDLGQVQSPAPHAAVAANSSPSRWARSASATA